MTGCTTKRQSEPCTPEHGAPCTLYRLTILWTYTHDTHVSRIMYLVTHAAGYVPGHACSRNAAPSDVEREYGVYKTVKA